LSDFVGVDDRTGDAQVSFELMSSADTSS